MFPRSLVIAGALGALALSGCGGVGDESADTTIPAGPVSTLAGVGSIPDTVAPNRQAIVMLPTPVNDDGSAAAQLGETTSGNRVLLIGDSILASTSSRYGGQMCDALEPLGWQVAVEAEPSRFIDFGNRVLDKVLDENAAPEDDWHAAVVFLGSNYGGDEIAYEAELREILDRLAPRPTLLFTVTEYRTAWSEVNDVVRRLGSEYDNVTLIDWEAISGLPGVLSSDRLHPTDTGRGVLAEAVANALGPAALGEGACLRSQFRDDSAIGRAGGGGSSVGSTSRSTRPSTNRPSTNRPSTATTTIAPTGGSSTGGGSNGDGSTGDGSTGGSTGDGSTGGDSTGGSTGDGSTGDGSTGDGSTGDGSTGDGSTGVPTTAGSTGGGTPTTGAPATTAPPPPPPPAAQTPAPIVSTAPAPQG
jgi:hypothetical protein